MADLHSLVTIDDPTSPASEAYRTLRMNLEFATIDQALRTILVTSPGADEDKATCLANLGVTWAQSERQVILVDCDLRRPALHTMFGLDNSAGLTSMMLDEHALASPPLQDTQIPGLQVLTSGELPSRPADLLGSKRMEAVIERLLTNADTLLFNAPPILAATDAAVLSTKVDGVLIVVSAGQTKRDSAQQAIARLAQVNANVLGAVLTNASGSLSLENY